MPEPFFFFSFLYFVSDITCFSLPFSALRNLILATHIHTFVIDEKTVSFWIPRKISIASVWWKVYVTKENPIVCKVALQCNIYITMISTTCRCSSLGILITTFLICRVKYACFLVHCKKIKLKMITCPKFSLSCYTCIRVIGMERILRSVSSKTSTFSVSVIVCLWFGNI